MADTYTGPLWVPGHPVAKGSMKCVTPHVGGLKPRLVPDERADPDGWVAKLPDALAWQAQKIARNPIDDPVELRADFYLRRPATTRFTDAPVGHGQGDLDKLVRMVGDAVGGGKTNPARLITDDSRIAKIVTEKHYATGREGARIELVPYVPVELGSARGMPVRIIAGPSSYTVGNIRSVADLPRLLRAVADQMERSIGKP